MKIREYSAPLTVLAAGVLGFSLICLVSAAALNNPGAKPSDMDPEDIVNSAFSKPINTAVALTAVEVSELIATPISTETLQPTSTVVPSDTATARTFVTRTFTPVHRERDTATPTDIPPTNTPNPTNTRIPPTFTYTPTPTDTDTPLPPTPTDTSPPPTPTDTSPPPTPTDTSPPPTPTDTPLPPPAQITAQVPDTPTPGP